MFFYPSILPSVHTTTTRALTSHSGHESGRGSLQRELLQLLNPVLFEPHAYPLGHGERREGLFVEVDRRLVPLATATNTFQQNKKARENWNQYSEVGGVFRGRGQEEAD